MKGLGTPVQNVATLITNPDGVKDFVEMATPLLAKLKQFNDLVDKFATVG